MSLPVAQTAAIETRDQLIRLITSRLSIEIIGLLRIQSWNPRELAKLLGKQETHVASRLKSLERAGLVKGKWTRIGHRNVKNYSLNADRIEIRFDFDGSEIRLSGRPLLRTVQLSVPYLFEAPETENFVGRPAELRALGSKKNIFLIEGIAGVGKTALAARFAEVNRRRNHVFWHSFKEVDSFGYLVSKLAVFASRLGSTSLIEYLRAGGQDDAVKMDLVKQAVDHNNHVLIFDDYQRHGDEKIDGLLRYLQQKLGKAKMIVLSRVRPSFFSPAENLVELAIGGLTFDEARQMIHREGVQVKETEAIDIYQATSGHPLFLRTVCSLAKEQPFSAVLELTSSKAAEYFWSELFHTMNPSEQDLCLALSVFRLPVAFDALRFVYAGRDLRRVLFSLQSKMIVNQLADDYFIHEVLRDFFYKFLADPSGQHKKAAQFYLLQKEPRSALEALHHSLMAEDYVNCAEIIKSDWRSGSSFIDVGLSSPYLNILDALSMRHLDPTAKGWVALARGFVFYHMGQIPNSIPLLAEAIRLGHACGDDLLIALALLRKGYVHLAGGELDEAESALRQGLERNISSVSPTKHASLLGTLGIVLFFKGELNEALTTTSEALTVFEKYGDIRGTAASMSQIGIVYYWKNDFEKSLEELTRAYEAFSRLDNVYGIGHCSRAVASVLQELGKEQEALVHFDQAVEAFQRISFNRHLMEAYAERAILRLQMGDFMGARDDLAKASQLRGVVHPCDSIGVLEMALGILAMEEGNFTESERRYKESEKLLTQLGYLGTLFRSRGLMELRRNKSAALEYLCKAKGIFDRMGSTKFSADIARAIASSEGRDGSVAYDPRVQRELGKAPS